MKYLISGIGTFLTILIVQGVLELIRRPRKAKKGLVFLPSSLAVIGLIGAVPFVTASIYTALTDKPIWIPIVFLVFSTAGTSLIIAYSNCRIHYDGNGFVHKSFLGIKRHYKYTEITAVKYGRHENFIYFGKCRMMVDELAVGSIDFFNMANRQYRKKHGTDIPERISRYDQIFSPDVQSAGTLFFIWGVIATMGLFFASLMAHLLILAPSENTVELIACWVIMVLSIVLPTVYILVTVNMARFPERYNPRTIQLWLYRDYARYDFKNHFCKSMKKKK